MYQVKARQVFELTKAQLKIRYRKAVGGVLWVVAYPLILYGVQSLIFGYYLKLDVSNYPLFLMGGLLPWVFFAQTLEMGTPILVNQGPFIRSFAIDPRLFLFALVAENAINLVVTIGFFFGFYALLHHSNPLHGVLALLVSVPLVVGTTGLVLVTASLHVLFRDIRFIVSFGTNVGYFLTPIFYPLDYIPVAHRWVLNWNPVYFWIKPIRMAVLGQVHADDFLGSVLQSVAVAFLAVCAGILVWKLLRKQVVTLV